MHVECFVRCAHPGWVPAPVCVEINAVWIILNSNSTYLNNITASHSAIDTLMFLQIHCKMSVGDAQNQHLLYILVYLVPTG